MYSRSVSLKISYKYILIISIVALAAMDILLRAYVGLSNDISGDTASYAAIAKNIAITGTLHPDHVNYFVEADTTRLISYPQLFL